jgi:hypothetical protein
MQLKIRTGILILTLFFMSSLGTYAQGSGDRTTQKRPFRERIIVGGGLGFSIGSYSSLVDVSPIIGYIITNELVAGVGFTYKYYRYKDYYALVSSSGQDVSFYDFKTNIYGMSFWARYYLTKTEIPVIENIFLHAEVEPLMFVNKYTLDPAGEYRDVYGNRYVREDDRINVTGYFLGGGLRQMLGSRSYMYLELLWNFNDELYSPYSNPRIRIGVAAGF